MEIDQESDRIERHIEQTREKLGRNLNELESRVRDTLDWRQQYDRNPWLVLGAVFGVGAAITATAGKRHSSNIKNYRADDVGRSAFAASSTSATPASPRLARTWGRMQDALLATFTRKAEKFLGEAVPGFDREYHATEDAPHGTGKSTTPPAPSPLTSDVLG